MPTNLLRRRAGNPPSSRKAPTQRLESTQVKLIIGGFSIRAELHPTPSAQRLLAALPLYSNVETWGESIHFEIPVFGGRDRTARLNALLGGFYYWAEEQRLILVYGPTPISGNGPIRLPRPCNVIGHTDDDLSVLRDVHPGQKVAMQPL